MKKPVKNKAKTPVDQQYMVAIPHFISAPNKRDAQKIAWEIFQTYDGGPAGDNKYRNMFVPLRNVHYADNIGEIHVTIK